MDYRDINYILLNIQLRKQLNHYQTILNKQMMRKILYLKKKVSIFYDRTYWALTYLKKAGLLIGTGTSFFKITERGNQELTKNPSKIMIFI